MSACHRLGISRRQLRNTLDASPRFRDEVQFAVEVARQSLEDLGYALARTRDARFLELMIKRGDQARQLAQARRDRLTAERDRAGQSDRDEIIAAVTATASLFITDVPPEKLPALMVKLKHLIGEVAEDDLPVDAVTLGPSGRRTECECL